MRSAWLGLFLLGMSACGEGEPPPPPEPDVDAEAVLSTDAAINGFDPSGAVFAVFGQEQAADNFDLEVFFSNREGLCDEIAAGVFDDPLLPPDGVHVQVIFSGAGNLPVAGTTLVNDAATALDFVNVSFTAAENQALVVAAFNPFLAFDDSTLVVDEFTSGVSLAGSFSSVLVSEESAFPDVQDINVAIQGSFTAQHCQAVSDALAE